MRLTRSFPITALLTAKTISDVGFALDFVCVAIFVWVHTESVAVMSGVSLALHLGGVIGGRLGHRYGDRWDRRRAMVLADLARMGALLILAALPGSWQIGWLFLAVLVVGGGRSVFEATFAAATPAFAGSRTQLVNSLATGLKGMALVGGMGLAAVAVPVIGYRGIFALDGASYALSAVAVLALPLRLSEQSAVRPGASVSRRGVWAVLLGAGLLGLLAVRGLDAFGSAAHHIGLPLLGAAQDAANPARVTGALWMSWAIGMTAGSLGLRPLLSRVVTRAPALVFFVATAVMSAGFIGIFWLGPWWAILAAAGIAGLGDALSEITFRQVVQRLPDEQRGTAFGVAQIVINAGFMAGLLTAGLVITPQAIAGWVLLLHGVPLLAAMVLGVTAASALLRTPHAMVSAERGA